jgi:drug/metabolite transporter (DMT)-like permease
MKMSRNGSLASPRIGRLAITLCLVGSVIGFALIPIFLRYFTDTLDAWTVNGVRYSVGALFWLPFLFLLDRNPTSAPPNRLPTSKRRNVWIDAIVPSLTNVAAQVAFALGPYYVSASTVSFTMRLSFLFTIVFGFIVLSEERLLARKGTFWFGAILSLFGVVAMYYDKVGGSGGLSMGMVLVLASAVGMGAYAVAVRYYMACYSARQSFSVISLYSSVLLVGLMFCFGDFGRLTQISPRCWLLLTLSALIGIAFGHVLLYQAIQYFGPVVASGVQLITPFITYLIAAFCLDERMSSTEWIGGILLVISGSLLVVARCQCSQGSIETIPERVNESAHLGRSRLREPAG